MRFFFHVQDILSDLGILIVLSALMCVVALCSAVVCVCGDGLNLAQSILGQEDHLLS